MYQDYQGFQGERIYIAGPECFYMNGDDVLAAMRKTAEARGFGVTLPNDVPLDLSHENLRLNADAIFANLKVCMNDSTAIIADLELYRGSEPDGGTIYEIGMAYARGLRCYGYTRDKRSMKYKHPGAVLINGVVQDGEGRPLPYGDLPFSPSVVGSCRIIEGDFTDALGVLMLDVEEERKARGTRRVPPPEAFGGKDSPSGRPRVYLAGPERYDTDAATKYDEMARICSRFGFDALTPSDGLSDAPAMASEDPYTRAGCQFAHWQQRVRECDFILANLNDFHGREPSSDVSFECGMGFQLGKPLIGYLSDTRRALDKIPHYEDKIHGKYKDLCGCDVENFDYPLNLMFSSSMTLFQDDGSFERIMEKAAAAFARISADS